MSHTQQASEVERWSIFPVALDNDLAAQVIDVQTRSSEIEPLVIMLGGSNGGVWVADLAFELAHVGYDVTGLAYFNYPGTPDRLIERPLEDFFEFLESVRGPEGQERCVVLVGASKGAELALLLATHVDDPGIYQRSLVDAVVAVAPSHVVWQAPHVSLQRRSSWSFRGEALPFVQYPWLTPHIAAAFSEVRMTTPLHNQALRNTDEVESAHIAVENIDIPVLLMGARNDPVWPSDEMAGAVLERAQARNPDHRIRLNLYDLPHWIAADASARTDVIRFVSAAIEQAAVDKRCHTDLTN